MSAAVITRMMLGVRHDRRALLRIPLAVWRSSKEHESVEPVRLKPSANAAENDEQLSAVLDPTNTSTNTVTLADEKPGWQLSRRIFIPTGKALRGADENTTVIAPQSPDFGIDVGKLEDTK